MVTGLFALYGAIALASSSMLASASPVDHLGGSSLKPRILGGSDANKSDYPFIVYLQNTAEQTYCGGSIISDDWVLTAAHCIKTASAGDLKVYIGQAEYNPDPSKATAVSSVTTHPGYDDSTMVNDLSLLKLATSITTSGNSSTISVDTSSVGDGVMLTALGWGYTSETSTTASKNLKEAGLTTLSQAECGSKDTKFTGNDGARICVAADRGNDTCPGDSGGPLIRQVNGTNVLVGVTSFGTAGSGQSITVNCGGSGMVSIFTHVNYYKSFIDSTTGGLRQIQGSNTDEGGTSSDYDDENSSSGSEADSQSFSDIFGIDEILNPDSESSTSSTGGSETAHPYMAITIASILAAIIAISGA